MLYCRILFSSIRQILHELDDFKVGFIFELIVSFGSVVLRWLVSVLDDFCIAG